VSLRRNWDEVNPPRVEESFPTQFPVESSKQPAVSLMPLENEEVAVEVFSKLPPVITSPLEEVNPAVEIPPAKVEVALFPCIVVVAVPPIVIVVIEERAVEEAFTNL